MVRWRPAGLSGGKRGSQDQATALHCQRLRTRPRRDDLAPVRSPSGSRAGGAASGARAFARNVQSHRGAGSALSDHQPGEGLSVRSCNSIGVENERGDPRRSSEEPGLAGAGSTADSNSAACSFAGCARPDRPSSASCLTFTFAPIAIVITVYDQLSICWQGSTTRGRDPHPFRGCARPT